MAVVSPFPVSALGDTVELRPSGSPIVLASAELFLDFDGWMYGSDVAGIGLVTDGPYWNSPLDAAAGPLHWVRVTVNSGAAPSGSATGVWLRLNVSRSWLWSDALNTAHSIVADITVEISSDAGGSVIVASRANIPVVVNTVASASGSIVASAPAGQKSVGRSIPGVAASGSITFTADGRIDRTPSTYYDYGDDGQNPSALRAWRTAKLNMATPVAPTWVRCTIISGTLSSGTVGSWVLGGTWTKGPSNTGDDSAIVTFELSSDAGGSVIVATYPDVEIGYAHGAAPVIPPNFWTDFDQSYEVP